jgi:hypothetical protein
VLVKSPTLTSHRTSLTVLSRGFTVWSTFIVDTLMTISGSIAAWRTLARGWGDLASLENLNWALVVLPFLSALGAFSLFSHTSRAL